MNASEIRAKTPVELEETLLELRKEQFNLRMQRGTGQLARPSEMNRVRKDIARVKTIINQMKAGETS
ncbi:MAG: 50S ribosomal protein L29 [Gammaproteobacteria bacterium]|nr:50S ribosomal protein L29 [Gammaproteobacteria bacterium]